MKYFIFVQDGKLNGAGECPQTTEGVTNLEVTKEVYDSYCAAPDKYIYDGSGVADNPNYEREQEAKRQAERRAELIEQLGTLDLQEIRPLAAKASANATEEDEAKLIEIEARKQEIRTELKELQDEHL